MLAETLDVALFVLEDARDIVAKALPSTERTGGRLLGAAKAQTARLRSGEGFIIDQEGLEPFVTCQ